MRPLRVVMQAFGPYAGRQVLDFRELGENRFFLIHGPTGSGKTTVLDAMCYALYGQTTGQERSAEQMRSHFADDATPTEVVFDFAVGEDLYRVMRRPAQERAKLRGSGTRTDAAEATLWRRTGGSSDDADGVPLAVKAREVHAEIERIVGFSADQFRQVVMLPQGRFRELLAADSGKREEILQALFGTERYSSIETHLKERKREIEAALAESRTRRSEALRSVDTDSDDALAESEAEAVAGLEPARGRLAVAQRAAAVALDACERGRIASDRLDAAARAAEQEVAASALLAECRRSADAAAAALEAEQRREPRRGETAARLADLERVSNDVATLDGASAAFAAARTLHEASAARRDELECARVLLAARHDDAMVAGRAPGEAEATLVRAEVCLKECEAAERVAGLVAGAQERIATAAAARKLAMAEATEADTAAAAARRAHEVLIARWRDGRAAALAASLEPHAPCPVCGSTEHPAPASADAAGPTDEALEAASAVVRTTDAACDGARKRLTDAEKELSAAEAHEQALGSAGPAPAELEPARAATRQAREAHATAVAQVAEAAGATALLESLRIVVRENSDALAQADAVCSRAGLDLAEAQGALTAALSGVPEPYRDPASLADAMRAAREAADALVAALDAARAADGRTREALAAAQERAKGAVAARETAERAAAGLVRPDANALAADAAVAAEARDAVLRDVAAVEGRVERLALARCRLADIDAEAGQLCERFTRVAALADAANGSNPLKLSFQRYVLGVFLTEVLEAATRRLIVMTRGRYRLHMAAGPRDRRSAAGLDLEVFDEYTGEDRAVSTLSGGEGFLASLALALGLAQVVEAFAGGVHLDTVFVDEGFGTLDEEALDTAIDALMTLQGSGRLVGIISHVPELQRAIPARLEITTSPRGSAARFIVP